MCELTKEAYEADTHQPLTASEIEALPTRKTWYGIVGTAESQLTPQYLSDDVDYAKAKAAVANREWEALGPWSVVTLFENLRMPA